MSTQNAINTASRAAQKRNEFDQNLKHLFAINGMIADTLAHDGDLERSIRQALNSGNENDEANSSSSQDQKEIRDFENFLAEQRERVKQVAKFQVSVQAHTQAYFTAMQEIQNEIRTGAITKYNNGNNEGKEDDKDDDDDALLQLQPPDYEVILQTKIELHTSRSTAAQNQNHPELTKIQENLREPSTQAQHDQDLELEIAEGESSHNYNCPITAQPMTDPVKNKVCGHYYSLKGIRFHLRSKRACPVPGCKNMNVNMNQLEEDVEMKMKVKRAVKRLEQEKKMRLTQADDLDEEDIMDDDAGFTVLE